MAKEMKTPERLLRVPFCPGCGHGIFVRLMQEVIEEKGLSERYISAVGVGCSSNSIGATYGGNIVEAHHGRAPSVTRAMKALRPNCFVWTYQGDGDAYAIGMLETIHAANADAPISVFVINNNNYGMTGGQSAPTTLKGQVTTTSPYGHEGNPIDIIPQLMTYEHVGYIARGTVTSAAEIRKLKGYIRKAVDMQMNENKYSFVEILSPCPTNWHKSPIDACNWINEVVTQKFPLGEFRG